MSAAVAEPPVLQKQRSRTFVAKRDALILTKTARWPVRDSNGVKQGETEGERIQFMSGRLTIPTDDGAKIRLMDGREVDAAPILEWIERHPLLNNAHEGFWELMEAAPAPSQEELEQLQDMAIGRDVDGLEAFIAAEREGWARPQLLAVAEGTIERVHKVLERETAPPTE